MRKLSILFGFALVIIAILPISPILADGPIEGRAGRAEIRFLEGMIDYHQMALDMGNGLS